MPERSFDWVDPWSDRVVNNGTYREYMRSRIWEIRARHKRAESPGRCDLCGKYREGSRAPQLDVHHLTYDRLGNELPEDLQVLCRSCHSSVHESKAKSA